MMTRRQEIGQWLRMIAEESIWVNRRIGVYILCIMNVI
jgi:hypothetical protein